MEKQLKVHITQSAKRKKEGNLSPVGEYFIVEHSMLHVRYWIASSKRIVSRLKFLHPEALHTLHYHLDHDPIKHT